MGNRPLNRAERRKKGITQPPPLMKHIPKDQYEKAIADAYTRGYNEAFENASNLAVGYMLAIPLLVLHDHYREVVRREWNGKSRYEHFFELCEKVFDQYNHTGGNDTLIRLCEDVREKTGFGIETVLFRRR